MVKGVITIEKKRRIADYVAIVLHKFGLYKTDGYYPVFDNETKKEVAQLVCVYGSKPIIRMLEYITDYHGPNGHQVKIDY